MLKNKSAGAQRHLLHSQPLLPPPPQSALPLVNQCCPRATKLAFAGIAIIAFFSACQPQGTADSAGGGNDGESGSTWYGMMRPVSILTGDLVNERRIPAHEMRSDEFFYYVVFEGVESRNALVKFSNLSQTALDVKVDDMDTASKWQINENGDISITEGSRRLSFVRAGSIVDYNIVTAGAGSTGSADVSGLQTQINALNTKISSLEAELLSDDEETGRVVALESARDALSMRIDALEDTTIPDLDDRIAVLEGVISTMDGSGDIGDLTNLIASVNDLTNWKNAASAELSVLRGDLDGVLAQLNGTGGLANWRNEASASLYTLSGETAYLYSELQAVKGTLAEITGASGDRVSEYSGSSPVTADVIGSSSAAYVTFAGIPKGEIVLFAALSASQTAVGPTGATTKSNWSKDGSGNVSYTTIGVNPAINGIWLCNDAACKELELQNKRFNTISANITTMNNSLDELADRITSLEEGIGAMLLPQTQINDIKAGGFASNNAKAAVLNTFFNQEGRKYFFPMNNVSSGWTNMPESGALSGNIELIRIGNILSCMFTINSIDGELTYRSYQGYWEVSSSAFTWQVPASSDNGWITVVGEQPALTFETKTGGYSNLQDGNTMSTWELYQSGAVVSGSFYFQNFKLAASSQAQILKITGVDYPDKNVQISTHASSATPTVPKNLWVDTEGWIRGYSVGAAYTNEWVVLTFTYVVPQSGSYVLAQAQDFSGQVTPGANIALSAKEFVKIGKQVIINVQITSGASVAGGNTVFTIPAGYRPKVFVACDASVNGASNDSRRFIVYPSDGTVKISNDIGTGVAFYLHYTYMIE
ncbi:MAG: hypothetical protein LBC77_06365 [Spirochaetaceae bacterium]|jgi:prefoldin subunit 5|nr:hypothetical protein [Spirochaetaceae bacterium]